MCTGGGSLLNGRCRGSMTLTPSGAENHIFPSGDLVTYRTCGCHDGHNSITPSELSKTVVWTVRFESLTQASNSERAIRTTPQAHVQPEGMIVVFDHPLNGVAGQAVLAGKSRDAAVFHSA